MATLGTSWAAFRANSLSGEAVQGYSNSVRELTDAAQLQNEASQGESEDVQLFVVYEQALLDGDTALAEDLRSRLFRENLSDAVVQWETQGDSRALTPFDD